MLCRLCPDAAAAAIAYSLSISSHLPRVTFHLFSFLKFEEVVDFLFPSRSRFSNWSVCLVSNAEAEVPFCYLVRPPFISSITSSVSFVNETSLSRPQSVFELLPSMISSSDLL